MKLNWNFQGVGALTFCEVTGWYGYFLELCILMSISYLELRNQVCKFCILLHRVLKDTHGFVITIHILSVHLKSYKCNCQFKSQKVPIILHKIIMHPEKYALKSFVQRSRKCCPVIWDK